MRLAYRFVTKSLLWFLLALSHISQFSKPPQKIENSLEWKPAKLSSSSLCIWVEGGGKSTLLCAQYLFTCATKTWKKETVLAPVFLNKFSATPRVTRCLPVIGNTCIKLKSNDAIKTLILIMKCLKNRVRGHANNINVIKCKLHWLPIKIWAWCYCT